ncbi:Hypothetical predicted protein [Paramuricea clavata]|uniref:Uncharacterized protein n=1 Tax=Paramuricea clavata TaxID=317549 RepID=A0A6S7GIA5_PARCT|nr:Hypothetical predicted protein [Paramuricea clavata]
MNVSVVKLCVREGISIVPRLSSTLIQINLYIKQAHCASTLKAPENERLKPRTIYSDGTTSISDEHCNQESPAGLLPIPVINTCKKLRILHKIPSLRVPAEIEQQAGVYELGNVKPENKKIVTVRSIYKKNQNGKKNVCKLGKKLAYSEVFNLPFHSTLKPVPSPDESFQPKPSSSRQPPPPVPCDISSLRPLTPVPSPSPEPSDSSYDRPSCCPLRSVTFNTTSSDNFQDCFQSSSASSSSDTTVSLKKNQRFVSDVVKTQETEDEARGDSTRVRALAKVFNLHLNSTLKPVPSPDDISSLRPLTPVPSPSPEPSDSSHDRPSCCPLRSVTFNTTSSDDFQDCFQSLSASSSSDTTVSLKTNKQFVSDVVKTQETENEARGDSSRVRALAMRMKPSKDKLKRSLPPSIKWNGLCVFDSGYPSLMVGDRIKSASEDEEFWEKRLANVVQTSPVKRHGAVLLSLLIQPSTESQTVYNTLFPNHLVFGLDIPHKHDLISAQELYQDFNANEVDVYLKERREQVDAYHLRRMLIDGNN